MWPSNYDFSIPFSSFFGKISPPNYLPPVALLIKVLPKLPLL
jgi:hypothetical protein